MKRVKNVHAPCPTGSKVHKPKRQRRDSETVQRTRELHSHSWYNLKRWSDIRLAHLSTSPLCMACLKEGKLMPGEIVDHVIPHQGAAKLFWDKTNLQTLCWRHHNTKSHAEKQGIILDYRENTL